MTANRFYSLAGLAVAAALALAGGAYVDDYPAKSIRFVVPIAPGGLTDTLTRLLGQRYLVSTPWARYGGLRRGDSTRS